MAAKPSMLDKLKFWRRVEAVTPEEARTRLQDLMGMLEKKTAYLEGKIEEETKTAIKYRATNKRGALMALRRRKRWQKQLDGLDNTTNTVEVQLDGLNNAHMNTEIVRTLRNTSEAIRQAHTGLSVDEVADLKDEIEDMMEDSQQITDILSRPIGGDLMDEDELLAELEEIGQEDLTVSLTSLDLDLPPVPTHDVKEKLKNKSKDDVEEEEDLRKLAEWM